MNLIFKWLNNFLFTSNIRPESSSYRFTDSKKKWGKYMSPNFINGLLFIIGFFIEILEEKGIKEKRRLLSLTVLNILELKHLKNAILEQSSLHNFNPERKYLFLQLLDEQRHDIFCVLSNYELYILQLIVSDTDQNELIQHYESIKTFKHELNSMMEINIQN